MITFRIGELVDISNCQLFFGESFYDNRLSYIAKIHDIKNGMLYLKIDNRIICSTEIGSSNYRLIKKRLNYKKVV